MPTQTLGSSTTRTPCSAARQLVILITCALALLATACTSGEPAASDPSNEQEGTEFPLSELLGLPSSASGGNDAARGWIEGLGVIAGERLTECMNEQGFFFEPAESNAGSLTFSDLESREAAQTSGFGAAPALPGTDGLTMPPRAEVDDPNYDYVQSLTPDERDAYDVALSGPENEGEFSIVGGGCMREAYDAMFPFNAALLEYGEELEEMHVSIAADPRVVEAADVRNQCITDAGYGFTDFSEASEAFSGRYYAILRDPDAFEPLPADEPVNYLTPPMKPAYAAQVDAIVEEEITAAVAWWDCSEPLKAALRDVQIEYEREFVAEHGDAIRAMLDDA